MLKKAASFVLDSSEILNGDQAASPLGGAHRRGAPYSSHRAPLRVRLRFRFAAALLTAFLSILHGVHVLSPMYRLIHFRCINQ